MIETGLANGAKLLPKAFGGFLNNMAYGNVIYVNSVTGSDTANNGLNPDAAYATLGQAVSGATANNNDIILLMPGHAESISSSTALNISKADLRILGVGRGGRRPTITLDTANTSTITVSANNVNIDNTIFVSNFLAVAALFTLTTAKDFQLTNLDVRDTDATHNFLAMVATDTTSNHADGLLIDSSKFALVATSGAQRLFNVLGTNDRCAIQNNKYLALTTGAGAVIPIATGKILTNFYLLNNKFNLQNAAGTGTGYLITTNGTTNTGFIDGNLDSALPTTPLLCTASSGFVFGSNLHTDQPDTSGYLLPVADA